MIRALSEPLVFFTIPFAVYVAWLLLRFTNPFDLANWTRRVLLPLALTGLVLTVGWLVVTGLTAPRYEGSYVPAHLQNGRIVPGRMQ